MEQTKRGRGEADREGGKREMIMSKAAVKSDLLAHHSLGVWTSGGWGCGEERLKGVR